ncbi:hypothetical protein FKG96_22385 [Olivibacter sp. LS-1]|nr:hypothetical protein FKG96_22385 [Olivibacter sp. LS-1]
MRTFFFNKVFARKELPFSGFKTDVHISESFYPLFSKLDEKDKKELEYSLFSLNNSFTFNTEFQQEGSLCVYMPGMGCNQCNLEHSDFLSKTFPMTKLEIYTNQNKLSVGNKYKNQVRITHVSEGTNVFFESAKPFYFLKYRDLYFNKFTRTYENDELYFDNLRTILK